MSMLVVLKTLKFVSVLKKKQVKKNKQTNNQIYGMQLKLFSMMKSLLG